MNQIKRFQIRDRFDRQCLHSDTCRALSQRLSRGSHLANDLNAAGLRSRCPSDRAIADRSPSKTVHLYVSGVCRLLDFNVAGRAEADCIARPTRALSRHVAGIFAPGISPHRNYHRGLPLGLRFRAIWLKFRIRVTGWGCGES